MGEPSETRRQLLHVAAGGFALLLRWLTWPQAAAFATTALAFNVWALPRLDDRLLRTGERGRFARSGIALYPASILALILLLRARLDIVAIAWAVLAAGDGMATLVGRNTSTTPLPWNRAKSVGGLTAFIVSGALAAIGIAWWVAPGLARGVAVPPSWYLLAAPVTAAVVAGFVETVPIRLDDNISVPAAAALVAWSLSVCDAGAFAASAGVIASHAIGAIVINGLFALAGWRARTVTGAGATAGAGIGMIVWLAAGPAGWTMLFLTFLSAAIATRMGHRRKTMLGIAEGRGGRRGPGNAIANTGIAAWAAVITLGAPDPTLAGIAMVAALTTAASDTVASEIGKAWGTRTWLVTTWRRVPAGTSGAISFEGTAANFVAAAALALSAAWLGLMPAAAVPAVTIAAVVASLIEGALGATLEKAGLVNNDAINFINTVIGAGLAMLLWLVR